MGVRIHSMAAHCDVQAGLDRQHASEEEGRAASPLRACASNAPHARGHESVSLHAQLHRHTEREPGNVEVMEPVVVCVCTYAAQERRAQTQ